MQSTTVRCVAWTTTSAAAASARSSSAACSAPPPAFAAARRRSRTRERQTPAGLAAFEGAPCFRETVERERRAHG